MNNGKTAEPKFQEVMSQQVLGILSPAVPKRALISVDALVIEVPFIPMIKVLRLVSPYATVLRSCGFSYMKHAESVMSHFLA
jgi:hypothetical protein